MFVINDDSLDTLKRNVDNVVNLFKALVSDSFSSSLFQIESQVLNGPLTSMFLVIIL